MDEQTTRASDRIGLKLGLRLILPFTLLFILNSLDRVNLSFAALQMNADLGFTPQAYGFGVSIFFFGYILLQYPHLWLQRAIGPRRWILAAALMWGSVATAMTFIQTATHLYVLRFLLGVAEAGFAPGVVLYMATFVPRRLRGLSIAGTMLAIPISVVIGGPLSGWLMTRDNPLGLDGWRWMFLAEGSVTIVAALLAYLHFRDRPEDVNWLTDEEKQGIRAELEQGAAEARPQAIARPAEVLLAPRTWAAAIAHFGLLTGSYTMIFWLPQALKRMSNVSDFEASALSAAPWAAFGAGMMLNAWHSDRTQERYWHFTVAATLSAACLMAAATLPAGGASFACLIAGAFFMGGGQGTFWPIPTGFLTGAAGPLGLAVINMSGNAAGVITPPIIGWIVQESGSFTLPIYILGGLMALSALMIPLIARLSRAPKASNRAAPQAA